MEFITLAHGNGGAPMQELIQSIFIKAFANPTLTQQADYATLPLNELSQLGNSLAFSTDSFVIDPITFPGGDIGKLAVCGTANDVAVSGAEPKYLSCGFMIEEGLPIATLKEIVTSMAKEAKEQGIAIVAGDTKVVPKRAVDKLFINTSGIGVIPTGIQWGTQHIQVGDQIIVSGHIGDHGATILNLRENLGLEGELSSDCQSLYPMIKELTAFQGIRVLRDATRGGVTAVLHEFAQQSQSGVLIHESQLPMTNAVRGICEVLGLDALNFANEGLLVTVVEASQAQDVLNAMRNTPQGTNAQIIGSITEDKRVTIQSSFGGTRSLDLPMYEPLPRIC